MNDQLKKELNASNNRVKALEQENTLLKNKFGTLEEKITSLESKLKEANDLNMELTTIKDNKELEIKQLKSSDIP